MFRKRNVLLVAVLVLSLNGTVLAQANPVVQQVVTKLEDPSHISTALAFVHFANENLGAKVTKVENVIDLNTGQIVPGYFSCTVRYNWKWLGNTAFEITGWSEMIYYFTGTGRYYAYNVGPTTAEFFKQFSEAEATVKIGRWLLKDGILPLVQDEALRRRLEWLIDNVSVRDTFHNWMLLQHP